MVDIYGLNLYLDKEWRLSIQPMAERTNIFDQKWNFKSTRAFENILTLQGSLFISLYPDWPIILPPGRNHGMFCTRNFRM